MCCDGDDKKEVMRKYILFCREMERTRRMAGTAVRDERREFFWWGGILSSHRFGDFHASRGGKKHALFFPN